jgi:hypothetical protein
MADIIILILGVVLLVVLYVFYFCLYVVGGTLFGLFYLVYEVTKRCKTLRK